MHQPRFITLAFVASYIVPGNTVRHDRYRVYAALMIIVYPLGMPLALGWWLFHHQEELRDPGRKSNCRIRPAEDLWGSYKRERYYYEVSSNPCAPIRIDRSPRLLLV